jgi:hypothetical protein
LDGAAVLHVVLQRQDGHVVPLQAVHICISSKLHFKVRKKLCASFFEVTVGLSWGS